LEELLKNEFSCIINKFLNKELNFIGFSDLSQFTYGNNLKWDINCDAQLLDINTDFVFSMSKGSLMSELVNFYDAIIPYLTY